MVAEKEYPKCQICGEEMANGYILRRQKPKESLYLCTDCDDLLGAVVHDGAYYIFDDIGTIMGEGGKTWKEKLELWEYKEDEEHG